MVGLGVVQGPGGGGAQTHKLAGVKQPGTADLLEQLRVVVAVTDEVELPGLGDPPCRLG